MDTEKKKQREVAILNIFFGMLIPFGAALAVALGGTGTLSGIIAAGGIFVACLVLLWWRISRVYQVIE